MFATTEEIISLVGQEPSPWTSARFYGVTALGPDDKTPVLVMGHLLFLAPGQEEVPVIPSIRVDPLVTIGQVELDLKTAVGVVRDLEAWKWPARLAETNVFGRNVVLPGAPGAWTPEKRTQGHYQPRLIVRRYLSGHGHYVRATRDDQVTHLVETAASPRTD